MKVTPLETYDIENGKIDELKINSTHNGQLSVESLEDIRYLIEYYLPEELCTILDSGLQFVGDGKLYIECYQATYSLYGKNNDRGLHDILKLTFVDSMNKILIIDMCTSIELINVILYYHHLLKHTNQVYTDKLPYQDDEFNNFILNPLNQLNFTISSHKVLKSYAANYDKLLYYQYLVDSYHLTVTYNDKNLFTVKVFTDGGLFWMTSYLLSVDDVLDKVRYVINKLDNL